MARLNSVGKCRVSPGTCHKCEKKIEVGEAYYWWQFYKRGKNIRCGTCRPQAHELINSPYGSAICELQNRDFTRDSAEDYESLRDELVDELENLKSEQEEKKQSMPEQLQETSSSAEMLQERYDNLESVIDELQSLSFALDNSEDNEDGEQEQLDQMRDEITNALGNLS